MKEQVSEAIVRAKNQVTIPQVVAERFDLSPGRRLVLIDRGDPDEFTVRVVRSSYAGALAGVFSESTDENIAYVNAERESWE